jgi:phosphoribosyl 1,2-cyclic phosphate phosphodiesterase
MRVEILGSAGAITTPKPGCDCRVCAESREKGVPYSRMGPCTFVHGPDVLIDTPEEIKHQLNRSRVREIRACLYSHWHPDHVMGRRVWEDLNWSFRVWPPEPRCTPIYLPEQVAADFREHLGSWEHLEFFAERLRIVELIEVPDGETVALNGTTIRPFRLAEDYAHAFLFEADGQRVLIAPDELLGWKPPEFARGVDLAVLPMGIAATHPLTGEQQIPAEHPVLEAEASFTETLEIVRALGARQVVLSHIEEADGVTYDDLVELERRLRADGLNICFAYDTMLIEV